MTETRWGPDTLSHPDLLALASGAAVLALARPLADVDPTLSFLALPVCVGVLAGALGSATPRPGYGGTTAVARGAVAVTLTGFTALLLTEWRDAGGAAPVGRTLADPTRLAELGFAAGWFWLLAAIGVAVGRILGLRLQPGQGSARNADAPPRDADEPPSSDGKQPERGDAAATAGFAVGKGLVASLLVAVAAGSVLGVHDGTATAEALSRAQVAVSLLPPVVAVAGGGWAAARTSAAAPGPIDGGRRRAFLWAVLPPTLAFPVAYVVAWVLAHVVHGRPVPTGELPVAAITGVLAAGLFLPVVASCLGVGWGLAELLVRTEGRADRSGR